MKENKEKKQIDLPFPVTGSTGMLYQITPHLRYAKKTIPYVIDHYSRNKIEVVLQQMWQGVDDRSQILWKDIEEVDIS